jgi:hypothetical protein
MLRGANRDRYGALRTELSNRYTFGNNLYPKTVEQCLRIMNRWMDSTPHQPCGPLHHPPIKQPVKTEDEELVFAQGTDKPSTDNKKNDSFSKGSSSLVLSLTGARLRQWSARIVAAKVMCQQCAPIRNRLSK